MNRRLGPLGWTGREAEWIALVCLHSGVFTRAQFCHYFNTQRMTALRFVKALIEQRVAVETDVIAFNGGGKTCRISGKGIWGLSSNGTKTWCFRRSCRFCA